MEKSKKKFNLNWGRCTREVSSRLSESKPLSAVCLSRQMMACEFSVLLVGEDTAYLRNACEEALDVAKAIEDQLSIFIQDSEVSYINALAARQAVRVETRLYHLLKRCAKIADETEGAFDVASGALKKFWNKVIASGRMPLETDVERVKSLSGMHLVYFDDQECAVRFHSEGVEIDLGAVGKGYAVDRIVETLREKGVSCGLISAGTSTIYALGCPPEEDAWKVGIRRGPEENQPAIEVKLKDEALSTSGVYEQYSVVEGRPITHIIDPRTGYPWRGFISASVIATSATDSDALATAFFILGAEFAPVYCQRHPGVRAIFVDNDEEGRLQIVRCGF